LIDLVVPPHETGFRRTTIDAVGLSSPSRLDRFTLVSRTCHDSLPRTDGLLLLRDEGVLPIRDEPPAPGVTFPVSVDSHRAFVGYKTPASPIFVSITARRKGLTVKLHTWLPVCIYKVDTPWMRHSHDFWSLCNRYASLTRPQIWNILGCASDSIQF
jgi:hypothetical protein